MSPRVSFFLPSHNKREYVLEAIYSIVGQTFQDWELWVLENSTDDGATRKVIKDSGVLDDKRIVYEELNYSTRFRQSVYITAWMLNHWYKKANGDLILYLSDDDLFSPDAAEVCVQAFDQHPDWDAAWFSLQHHISGAPYHTGPPVSGIAANSLKGPGQMDCQADGGQVVHTRRILDEVPEPWFPETDDPGINRHCDGLFLENIASKTPFHPIPKVLVHHRYTSASTWTAI
jgi:spore maturation protein CgeD